MVDTDFNTQVRETILHLLNRGQPRTLPVRRIRHFSRYMGTEDWDGLLK